MGFDVVCESCQKQLSIPAGLYDRKVRGRVVTIHCKRCGASIRIDGTVPPPEVEPRPSAAGQSGSAGALEIPSLGIPKAPRLPHTSDAPAAESANGASAASPAPPEADPLVDNGWDAPEPVRDAPDAALASAEPVLSLPVLEPDNRADFSSESPDPTHPDGNEESEHFPHADGPISVRAPIATIGRYTLFDKFATGGMATVHFGRLDGAGGFSRVVAIKRLLPHLVRNSEFVDMLLNEAKLAARVRHPNVVAALDVVASKGDVLLVLEYVHGEALGALCRSQAKTGERIPLEIAASIMLGVLEGLHSVHETADERGRPLGLVHRDVSPPNVIVGVDGLARVLDFGIVKALERIEESVQNRLKGKTGYMSPEQIKGERVTRRSDIFAAGIVLWELLTLRRFAAGKTDRERMEKILHGAYPRPSEYRPEIAAELDDAVMRALAIRSDDRYTTAREFAQALEAACPAASPAVVAHWVNGLAENALAERARRLAQVENWRGITPRMELSSRPFAADLHALGLRPAAAEEKSRPPSSRPRARAAAARSTSLMSKPLLLGLLGILFVIAYLALRSSW